MHMNALREDALSVARRTTWPFNLERCTNMILDDAGSVGSVIEQQGILLLSYLAAEKTPELEWDSFSCYSMGSRSNDDDTNDYEGIHFHLSSRSSYYGWIYVSHRSHYCTILSRKCGSNASPIYYLDVVFFLLHHVLSFI